MLGYSENDLDEMIGGLQIAISALEKGEDNDEVLEWLNKTGVSTGSLGQGLLQRCQELVNLSSTFQNFFCRFD